MALRSEWLWQTLKDTDQEAGTPAAESGVFTSDPAKRVSWVACMDPEPPPQRAGCSPVTPQGGSAGWQHGTGGWSKVSMRKCVTASMSVKGIQRPGNSGLEIRPRQRSFIENSNLATPSFPCTALSLTQPIHRMSPWFLP